jgi:hypothetical protein
VSEVRVEIDQAYLEDLKRKLGVTRNVDLIQEALALLNWSADEVRQGRQILSADPNLQGMTRLVTPRLKAIAK